MQLAKHHQLYRHEPHNDIPGDCWRTAIGCALGLPPHKVPHFVLEAWKGAGKTEDLILDWLKQFGLSMARVQFNGTVEGILDYMHATNPGITYFLSGKSPRGNWTHVVIALGGTIVWDPAPEGSKGWGTLDGPCPEHDMLEVEFFVPLMGV